MKRFLAMLKQEFRGYNAKALTGDLLAGVTVAAVALPLALAFGVSSGADAAAGLITAIIAGLVIGTLSGGYYQISGPTGAMAAILMSLSAQYGISGIFVATFLAGVLLLIAGIFKLGKLTSFIPMPVVTGFTSGIAVIIALGQVDNLFGVTSVGHTTVEKLLSYGELGFPVNFAAVALGVLVMVIMLLWPKKWNGIVPGSLVGIIVATIVSVIVKPDVAVVGAIPQTLLPDSRLTFDMINMETLPALVSPAVSIAILGMIESLLCGASAGRMTGVRLDANQELIAQGVGNVVLPFVGGIPATAAIARTSVAIKSGARTRLTGIVHALALLVFMLVLAPIMSLIPLSALAGVLIITAWRMNEFHAIKYIFSHKLGSAIVMFLATMIATILFDLTIAILIGVGIAVVCMLGRLSKLMITFDGDDEYKTVRICGPMLFASATQVEDLAEQLKSAKAITFDMRAVSDIDVSGAQAFTALHDALFTNGTEITVSGLSDQAKIMFERCGLVELFGKEHISDDLEVHLSK